MSQKPLPSKLTAEVVVLGIRRVARRHYSAEDKIRIVLEGAGSEHSIAERCRRKAIAERMYYSWSKVFHEAGKRRLARDTAREATSGEVKALRHEAQALKEVVAEQDLELRLLKKEQDRGWGRPRMRYPSAEKLQILQLVEQSHLQVCKTQDQLDTRKYPIDLMG